jgi:hypothetical protein
MHAAVLGTVVFGPFYAEGGGAIGQMPIPGDGSRLAGSGESRLQTKLQCSL